MARKVPSKFHKQFTQAKGGFHLLLLQYSMKVLLITELKLRRFSVMCSFCCMAMVRIEEAVFACIATHRTFSVVCLAMTKPLHQISQLLVISVVVDC